jgi:hypothetical protein
LISLAVVIDNFHVIALFLRKPWCRNLMVLGNSWEIKKTRLYALD